MKQKQSGMSKAKVNEILELLAECYPDARCELNYETPFQLLVATMLSAQSTDKTVNRITEGLFKRCPDLECFLGMTQEELEKEIREIGLFRNKAKNILSMCRELAGNFGGEVPSSLDDLTSLPGVGRKTANVVLSNAFGIPALAVDTHVFRVSNRIGIASGNNVGNIEEQLMKIIPENRWSEAHHLLIRHGRRTCDARRPKCESCVLMSYCEYVRKKLK